MLNQKKQSELIAFVWLIAAVLLFLCLLSYDPTDISWHSSSPNTPPKNIVGIIGAYAAWALSFVLGKGAYGWVGLFVFWSVAQWSDRPKKSVWLTLISGTLFFVSISSTLSLLFSASDSVRSFEAGGVVGYFGASTLTQLFGSSAFFVSICIFLIALILATDFIFLPILWSLIKKTLPKIAELISSYSARLKKSEIPGDSLTKTQQSSAAVKTKIKINDWQQQSSEDDVTSPDPVRSAQQGLKPKVKPAVKKPDASRPSQDSGEKASKPKTPSYSGYKLPATSLLQELKVESSGVNSAKLIEEQSALLQETLSDFGVDAKVVEAEQGPVITRFELQPASGVKLQRITGLQDNISLALKATSVRILAPIPGKNRVGIEVPNSEKKMVGLKNIIQSKAFKSLDSKLAIALGMDAAGQPLIADLDQMPHMLIAGATGSGKTVCMNTIIMSILFNATPEEVKFIMIDPKMVELNCYNGIPHLMLPVVTDVEKAPMVLNWLTMEMERRYKILSKTGDREVEAYNAKIGDGDDEREHMPYIVVIIDELADLMMAKGKEVETAIARLAQLARAIGIHMVLATQRPSVDVITGVIKANFPARLAFQVASKVDSRTVLDSNGAESLLGKGDLLFMHPANSHMIRGQGAWVTDAEIQSTIETVKAQGEPVYQEEILKSESKRHDSNKDFRKDHHYPEACRIIVSSGQASVSMLQRRLGLGYTRAARLVDMMEEDGIVGPHRGAKPREVLVSPEELEARLNGADSESEETEVSTE